MKRGEMRLFSKAELDVEFEAALHRPMSRQRRGCVAKSQDVIRAALLPAERPRFILVEEYTGSWFVVVTDRRLLMFETSFSGVCRNLAFAGFPGEFALDVETNWSTRGSAVVVVGDGFRIRLRVAHPATAADLVRAAERIGEVPAWAPALPTEP
jgi:hypothetical protein